MWWGSCKYSATTYENKLRAVIVLDAVFVSVANTTMTDALEGRSEIEAGTICRFHGFDDDGEFLISTDTLRVKRIPCRNASRGVEELLTATAASWH